MEPQALIPALVAAPLAGGAVWWVMRARESALRREAEALAAQRIAEIREAAESGLNETRAAHEAQISQLRGANQAESERLHASRQELDVRSNALEQRRDRLDQREQDLKQEEVRVAQALKDWESRLESLSGLSKEEARTLLQSTIDEEFRRRAIEHGKSLEREVESRGKQIAHRTLLSIMERNAAEYVTEATTAVISLPTDDMKGRLIGREGRNIRAFEQVTGVDLIIDETPEAVVISSFDPIRREVARLTLMNLMLDGRIHPGRIEELFEQATAEVHRTVMEAGERAAERANVADLPIKVVETMGRLRFRTSLGQNILDHSVEVAGLSAMLAAELGLNTEVAKRAGFLHDIGKALPSEWEGPHALTGMEFLRQCDLPETIFNAVGAHHREIEPKSAEAEIVIVADTLSAARPGARRENLDHYVKRLSTLEEVANNFKGVERVFAMQAGRELRVVVRPEELDDLQCIELARDLARKIEADLDYPGTIKVTVIRERRFQETAR